MGKSINIELTKQEQEDFEKIIAVCRHLSDMREKYISEDDIILGATLVRALLGDDESTSLLYRAGFTNMRFLDTARPINAIADYNIQGNLSNWDLSNPTRLPLLIKNIENDIVVNVAPLRSEEERVKQSASINYNQWYLSNRVYEGKGMALNRQSILQLLVLTDQQEPTAMAIRSGMIANSGIIHKGKQIPFAINILSSMADEIIFEVIESLRIEGILGITDVNEFARIARKNTELFMQSISIENYKLFDNQRIFTFKDRFSVLIGDNATGKTSILDAMRIALDFIIPHCPDKSKHIISSGLKEKFSLQSVHREIENNKFNYTWPAEIIAETSLGEIRRTRNDIDSRSNRKVERNLFDIQGRLPLIAYCGVERTRPLETRKLEGKRNNNRYDGYIECLNTRTSIAFLRVWLKELQQRAKKSAQARNTLECFVNAVCSCLQNENIVDFRYIYQLDAEENETGTAKVDDIVLTQRELTSNRKKHLVFSSMSAGYKVMVGLIADLAYRCIILNPQLEKDAITGTSGIVLIDEIDMHLHPLWQRHIVEDLMRCFPKVQFIATTHSPFIVQSLKKEQVISLAGKEIESNPTEANIDASIRYMGIDNMYGKDFNNQVTLAKKFFTILRQKDVNENELRRIHAEYVRRYGDDAVLLARLNLAETVAYERHKG